jgi:hypothetical protein
MGPNVVSVPGMMEKVAEPVGPLTVSRPASCVKSDAVEQLPTAGQ